MSYWFLSNTLTCYVTCPPISYAEVRSPGFLHFYKDKKAADQNRFNDPSRNSDPQITIVDLRSVVDFAVPEKKNKDNLELELVTATESIRLKLVNSAFFSFISSIIDGCRFRSVADVEKWKKGLAEWKDFNMDYGMSDILSSLCSLDFVLMSL